MHLVQLLLPRGGERRVLHELTERFGGATAYSRAPAEGLWKPSKRKAERDDIIVVEVMVKR